MANVPVYDKPEVTPGALPGVRYHVDSAANPGLAQVAGNIGDAATAIGREYVQEKHRASAEEATELETQLKQAANSRWYNADPNAGPLGLMQQRGEAAMADTDPGHGNAYGALENARASLAQQASNPLARDIFLKRSQAVLSEYRRIGEEHVGSQRQAAAAATLTANSAEALRAISLRPEDDKWAESHLVSLEGPIRAQALSKAQADGQISALRAKAAEARLNQLVDKDDAVSAAKAQSILEANKPYLGDLAEHYQYKLDVQASKVEGVTTAQKLVSDARSRNPEAPFLDVSKLDAALQALPPSRSRAMTEAEVTRLKTSAMQAETDLKKAYFDKALTGYLSAGNHMSGVSNKALGWLQENDPEGLVKLQNIAKADQTHARAGRERLRDTPEESRALIEALTDINRNREDWLKRDAGDLYNPDTAPWATELSEKGKREVGEAFARLKSAPRKAPKDTPIPAGEAHAVETFVNAELHYPANKKTWTAEQVEAASHAMDHVAQQRLDYRHANAGREPTHDMMMQWAREETARGKVPGSGLLFDDKPTRAEYETRAKYQGKTFVPANGVPAPKQTPPTSPAVAPLRQKGKDGNTYEYNPATKGWRKMG